MAEQTPEKPEEVPEADKGKALTEPETEEIIPEEVREALEKVPPQERRQIRRAFSAIFSGMTYTGPMPDPILRKVTSEHITDIIRVTDSENLREHQAQRETRRYMFWVFLISTAAVVGMLVFLVVKGQTDLVRQVLIGIGGLGGGFGLGRWRRPEG